MRSHHLFTTVLLIICINITGNELFAQDEAYRKKIQAVINLTRFIDWSQNEAFKNGKKRLYVLIEKNTRINYELKYENTATFRDWQVVCTENICDFENGSVVFVTGSKEKYIAEIIGISRKKEILTVSENDNTFCARGGMINIRDYNNQIKFEINYKIIQDKSLDISSKLLALSKIYN